MEADRALSLVASVEANSQHFLARETVRKAREKSLPLVEAVGFEALEGMGVKGRIGDEMISVGNRRLMARETLRIDPAQEEKAREAEARGMTVSFAGWGGETQSLLFFGDSLRKGVREMVQGLHARGISTWLVSGDSRETTLAVAGQCGIPQFRGEALPQEKVGLIKTLQEKGRRVGMVGDGINDAPALAQAQVGIAMGTGTDVAMASAGVTLVRGDLQGIVRARRLSRATMRNIRQNLFFAFIYNTAGVPIAAGILYPFLGILLSPMIAAAAMSLSSVSVIGNSLRLRRVIL